jgi:imidazolonepropionase-like amidohydrolase
MRTIEHGFYLHRRPDLLERMAEQDVALVPTFSSSYWFAGRGEQVGLEGENDHSWIPEIEELADNNIRELEQTIQAAHAAGTPIALGGDGWQNKGGAWSEIKRMVHHGLPARDAFTASTSVAARMCNLGDELGTVEAGKLADLVVFDGDPIEDLEILADKDRVWLVLQLGEPVAGAALEIDVADLAAREPALA